MRATGGGFLGRTLTAVRHSSQEELNFGPAARLPGIPRAGRPVCAASMEDGLSDTNSRDGRNRGASRDGNIGSDCSRSTNIAPQPRSR
jgi:hypothetical protein